LIGAQAEDDAGSLRQPLAKSPSQPQNVDLSDSMKRKANKRKNEDPDEGKVPAPKRRTRKSFSAAIVNSAGANEESVTTERTHLLTLPAELRNQIWQLVVVSDVPLAIVGSSPEQPGLTRACRQTRNEALGFFYRKNTFNCTIANYDPSNFKKYRKIADQHGLNTVLLTHRFESGAPREVLYNNLLKWLEGTFKGETAPLGYSSGHSDKSYDWSKLSHRIVKVFNVAKMLKDQRLPWSVAKEILSNAVDAAGVCGETRR
jgi:hypothetical protein